MLHLAQLVPAEEEQADEGRLQEEGHPAFAGQDRSEDVTYIMRVVGPVGAELEFQRQSGGDTHGEVDPEQLAPEAGHVLVDLAPGHHIDRLHDRQDKGHAQRQRHEQEVIKRGQPELESGQGYDVIAGHGESPRIERWWNRVARTEGQPASAIAPRYRAARQAHGQETGI